MRILILIFAALTAQAELVPESQLQLSFQTGFNKTSDEATNEYWSKCEKALSRFKSARMQSTVSGLYCEDPADIGNHHSYRFGGTAIVAFQRPVVTEQKKLEVVAGSSAEASAFLARECLNWIGARQAIGSTTLLEDCGDKDLELLGLNGQGQPVWKGQSQAVRVYSIKSAFAVYPSCYCRESSVPKNYIDPKTHRPKQAYHPVFDLMYLDNAGSYRPLSRWNVDVECHDAISKNPVCKEK